MQMDKFTNYCEFKSTLKILHNDSIKNYSDAIKFFIENESDTYTITYKQTKKIILFNIDMMKINANGNYYFDFSMDRKTDIIDDINIEFENIQEYKMKYLIGGNLYEPENVNEFIFIAAQYHEFRIQIEFLKKPINNIEFCVSWKSYILNKSQRRLLGQNPVFTKSNLYLCGMFGPNKHKFC